MDRAKERLKKKRWSFRIDAKQILSSFCGVCRFRSCGCFYSKSPKSIALQPFFSAERLRLLLRCSGILPLRAIGCHENSFFVNKKASANTEAFTFQAPRAGFEPATNRLTVDRSTAELPRNVTLRTYPSAMPSRKGFKSSSQRWTVLPSPDSSSLHPGSSISMVQLA